MRLSVTRNKRGRTSLSIALTVLLHSSHVLQARDQTGDIEKTRPDLYHLLDLSTLPALCNRTGKNDCLLKYLGKRENQPDGGL